MPGLYPPFAQRPFSDDDKFGRGAQRDLCDRVGFDDLQGAHEKLVTGERSQNSIVVFLGNRDNRNWR
jgi:hypothetical protein